jgi:hypothetical protein
LEVEVGGKVGAEVGMVGVGVGVADRGVWGTRFCVFSGGAAGLRLESQVSKDLLKRFDSVDDSPTIELMVGAKRASAGSVSRS